jgi:hypothetical protein
VISKVRPAYGFSLRSGEALLLLQLRRSARTISTIDGTVFWRWMNRNAAFFLLARTWCGRS